MEQPTRVAVFADAIRFDGTAVGGVTHGIEHEMVEFFFGRLGLGGFRERVGHAKDTGMTPGLFRLPTFLDVF